MASNRRNWLKQMGIGFAGMGLMPLDTLANFSDNPNPKTIFGTKENPILLNSNENPYGPSPLAKMAITNSLVKTNRYNWGHTNPLKKALAQQHSLTENSILLNAGSTEILDLVVRYAAQKKGNSVIAHPTFAYWTELAENLGLKTITVPLTADKVHDLDGMLHAINSDTQLVYICNPNNPTGTLLPHDTLVNFANEASKKALLMVDEAYLEFTQNPSLSSLVATNENIVIVKTFSKIYGLAGARIGYAIAHSKTIAKLEKLQSLPNGGASVISVAAALASLNDKKFVKEVFTKNNEAKNYTIDQLTRLGIKCIKSNTNFIYFSLEKYSKDYFGLLASNHIIGTKWYEESGKWTRITVGTLPEMQAFIKAIS